MTNTNVTLRLMTLAADRFGKDIKSLTPQDDFFEALGIDSLQALDLLTRLEEEFGVEVPDYELADIKTFEALAGVIEERQ